jgi:hypothetical protein
LQFKLFLSSSAFLRECLSAHVIETKFVQFKTLALIDFSSLYSIVFFSLELSL